MSKRLTNKEFIERAVNVHGDKYDYSKVNYIDAKTNVCIICPKHGEFMQLPTKHLSGHGCHKCAEESRNKNRKHITSEQFISDAIKIHGDKYDYSLVKNCINNATKVQIICKKHGVFEQDYAHHVYRGHGCPKCGEISSHITQRIAVGEYESKASKVHDGKYSYSGDYTTKDKKIKIICPIHGAFEQEAESHLQGHGCPKCGHDISKSENEIYEYLCKLYGKDNVLKSNYGIIGKKELDIYIPSKKIAIEYNGLRWHSEQFGRDRKYHINKLNSCNDNNIKLIQIFEDEYKNNKEIVYSKLKHILNLDGQLPKIYARKTIIKEINKDEAKEFFNKNHIQGYEKFTVCLGSFFNDKLIGAMSFVQRSKDFWELNRFATDNNLLCIGVGGKLFSYFIRNYNPEEVKSFADRRWTINSENNLYTKLGFKLEKNLKPDYRYFNNSIDKYDRIHKFNFRKQRLHKKYGFPLSMTEKEMAAKLGYYRIWDCGLFKYVWIKPNKVIDVETTIVD